MTSDDSEPVSRSHVSQGLKLHYLDWGNEGAPVLLLVHGMRDHARSWDWTARALRDQWHIIAPDLRGHGDSQWSPDGAYLGPYHVFDLAELTEKLGPDPLTLVGHSYGGSVCSRFAAIFPHRVRKLVLVDGLGPSPGSIANWNNHGPVRRTHEWIEKRRQIAVRKPRRFATPEEAVARMAAANRHLSEEQARHLALHGIRLHSDGYGWKYDPNTWTFLPEEFAVDSSEFWRDITAPTLLLWGTESWTASPDADTRTTRFPDYRTAVFENAGHWLHHDQLAAFLATLKNFL
jgi:pimeloyl-ACP methyl ester carboxylesterase